MAVLAVLAAGVLSLIPAGTQAGVVGSPHDFSGGPYATSGARAGLAPAGACSACHIPHNAVEGYIWPRLLTQLKRPSHLVMDNLATYNYVLPPAIQCYDCHDGDSIPAETQDPPYVDPTISGVLFDSQHKPQNTLFGFRKDSLGNMTPFPAGPQAGKVIPGYYETTPPGPASSDGVNTSAPLNQTGGHYFKQDPVLGGVQGSVFDIGDKLPCRDCHDPHAWDSNGRNQAFIRKNFPGGTINSRLNNDVRASEGMANAAYPTIPGRDNVASRRICAACHGFSDTSPVNFSEINAGYRSDPVTGTNSGVAATVAEHRSTSQAACVTCHPHNSVGASCSQCHGFPPPLYPPALGAAPPAAYTQRDPHSQHIGRLSGQPPNSFSVYKFECTVCHATSAMGSRSAEGIHATGEYNIAHDFSSLGVANPPDSTSMGGKTCGTVYCHSNGGSDNTMAGAGNYFRTVQWGFTTQGLRCNACHGPSTPDGVIQTGMPEYPTGEAGSPTANSHAAHVVNYECSVCHFATTEGTYAAGRTIKGSPLKHVNGIRDVVFDDNNAIPGSLDDFYHVDNTDQTRNKRCDVSCHGTGKPLLERPQWGGTLPTGCFSCHGGAEQIYKPQVDYGVAGAPNPVDNNEYLSSGHGRTAGVYPGDNNLPAGFGNYTISPTDCYYCHSETAAHTIKDPNDPFRLGYGADAAGQKGYVKGAYADNTDALCLRCHGVPDLSNPQRAMGAAAQNMQTHAYGITGTKYSWTNTPWKCADCHDPHGDGKPGAERWMMVRSGINAPTSTGDGANSGSDIKSIPKRTASVSAVAFNSQAGFAAGSYAQPGNGSGGAWGPCEVCHNRPNTYSRTVDNDNTHATRTGRCTTCHPHSAGFGPKACRGCHGGDTGDAGQVSNNAPNITAYWTTSGHGQTFASRGALGRVECEECHDVGYLSSSSHKTDGTAGAGPPPANVNTLGWPGKPADNGNNWPTVNTSHLRQTYFPSAPANKYEYALSFDRKCGNPVTGCHPRVRHNQHPQVPAGSVDPVDNVLRFGDYTTKVNPKGSYWYPAYSSYRDDFYASRSPWVINDVTTNAGGSFPDAGTAYGVCVTCHDPHGTNAPANLGYPTNMMLRGNSQAMGQFCNIACHAGSP